MRREHSDLLRRVAKLESDRRPSLATMLREMYADDFDEAARLLARCLRYVDMRPHENLVAAIGAARTDEYTAPWADALEAIVTGHLADAERIIAEIETVPAARVKPVIAVTPRHSAQKLDSDIAPVVPITRRQRHVGFS